MARMQFSITDNTTEETVTVVAGQADIIAMERQFGIGAGALAENPHMEHVAFIAWRAATRNDVAGGLAFDPWLERYEVEPLDPEASGNS